jgi:octanoyl-[GcvH]:protein N-octanoyltransferase
VPSSRVPVDLLTAGFPADPVLDAALSHALLEDVAARRRSPALRIFRPGPAAAFGRLDALLPGFPEACERARQYGRTPLVRLVGGHAAVYDERCVVVEEISAEDDVIAALQARFEGQSRRLQRALSEPGADARIGELPGEYCRGAHSINLGGRIKVVGIAQRAVRRGALASAVVVCGGGAELRAIVASLYAALEIAVDPGTAGSLDEELPDATAGAVARLIEGSYAADWRLEPRDLDADLLGAARALAARHRAP